MQVMKKESLERLLLRISACSDVKASLNECYAFFKKFFPLDIIGIVIHAAGQDTLRVKALIREDDVLLMDELISLSAGGRKQAEKAVEQRIVFRATHETAIIKDFATHMGLASDKHCSLHLTTEIGPSRYVSIGLLSIGEDKFHREHIDALRDCYDAVSAVVCHLLSQIETAIGKERLAIENRQLRRKLGFLGDPLVLGRESGLRDVMNQVEQVASVESPVLIMGETGVGKEVVARAIHRRSSRADKHFISINCGAIPETLLDSELFGYEKGAFTGATSLKRGYFEQADEGTIFLDEIGELSLQAQVKLLRLLQTMQFQRVGGSHPISVDVRVIAATNRDLRAAIKEQKFRKDLWFRLNVFPIQIPSLRERKEDIPTLAEHFAHRKSAEMNLPFKPSFAEEAIEQLQAYDWPGNVRELQNVIERALILSQGNPLSFPNLNALPIGAKADISPQTGQRILTLDEVVIQHIQNCLIACKGQVGGPGGAAELLGVNPSTLRGKMRKHGIRIKRLAEHKSLST